MKKVAFHTLGCKVNQYETEAMEEMFEKKDYQVVSFQEKADIYVINTCTVTNIADKKSRQMLSKARKKNPIAIVVAVGCYAQIAQEKLQEDNIVDLVIGSNNKNKIVELVEAYYENGQQINIVEDISNVETYENIWITKVNDKTRAYIKIQDGCNQFCSYCIIPYTRGRIRSREKEDIIKEVKTLANNGYIEIVLTGIHIASYGIDLENTQLLSLLEEINQISGIKRIRLGSLEPGLMDETFIKRLSTLKKICPHFHLSLQSGCNETLKRMNRKYTTEEYFNKVSLLRHYYENPSITTDIIVGFPGETEDEFKTTLEFAKEVQFSNIHIFKYSKREGTPAAKRNDQVTPNIKSDRSNKLLELEKQLNHKFLSRFIDKDLEVLFEETVEHNGQQYHMGLTDTYIKVKVKIDKPIKNTLYRIKITDQEDNFLYGEKR